MRTISLCMRRFSGSVCAAMGLGQLGYGRYPRVGLWIWQSWMYRSAAAEEPAPETG